MTCIMTCSICLSKLNGRTKKLFCNHVFHRSCINRWLKHNSTCPCCRGVVNSTYMVSVISDKPITITRNKSTYIYDFIRYTDKVKKKFMRRYTKVRIEIINGKIIIDGNEVSPNMIRMLRRNKKMLSLCISGSPTQLCGTMRCASYHGSIDSMTNLFNSIHDTIRR